MYLSVYLSIHHDELHYNAVYSIVYHRCICQDYDTLIHPPLYVRPLLIFTILRNSILQFSPFIAPYCLPKSVEN